MKTELPEHVKRKASKAYFISFKISKQIYALPLENVENVHRMVAIKQLPAAPPWVAGVINLHGQVIAAIDLRRRLGQQASKARLADRILIVNDQVHRMALIVEEASEVMEVAIWHYFH